MLENAGRVVSRASTAGLRAEGRVVQQADASNAAGARRALMNPYIDVAVLEVAEGSVLSEGLGFDRCDVSVVMGVKEGPPLGGRFRWTGESVWKAVRAPVDIVPEDGVAVLCADDPEVVRMAPHCRGEVIFFGNPDAPALREHVSKGGRAIAIEPDGVSLLRGAKRERVVSSYLAGRADAETAAA